MLQSTSDYSLFVDTDVDTVKDADISIDNRNDLQDFYNNYNEVKSDVDFNLTETKAIMRNIMVDHKRTLQILYSLLPPKVVSKLRNGEQILPEKFQNVTIFFSDIVGFTKIASGIEPELVVKLLNDIYLIMDYCCSLFPLFKVETIGDAYMIVSGINHRLEDNDFDENEDTAVQNIQHICDFALCVREAVKLVKSPIDGKPIQLRIGINTGPIVAGVAGSLMPRYCLFGHAVNLASRMESSGEPNKIQISENTAKILATSKEQLYNLQSRDPINVKGITHKLSNFWIDSMTEGHAKEMDITMQNIIQVANQMVLDFESKPNEIGVFPHFAIPSLKDKNLKQMIRKNSIISNPIGSTSGADITRVLDACDASQLTESVEAETIPINVLIVCGLSKARLNIVSLMIEVFGDGINFIYADNNKQAREKVVTSIQDFSIVLVDESNDAITDTLGLLFWLKTEINGVTTVTFKSNPVPTLNDFSKSVDFTWKKIPMKEDFVFALVRSSNPLKNRFLNELCSVQKEPVQRPNPKFTILILVRNLSKSKMINKQVESVMSKFANAFEIKVASNGHEAVELIYGSYFLFNMIMIDNALGTSLKDVTFSEVIRHVQYAESTKEALVVGLTTSSVNTDCLLKSGCDAV